MGAASIVVIGAAGCPKGKSAAGAIAIIIGAITDLKGVFPALDSLSKIVTLAESFNGAWVDGKFDSARTFFDNLDGLVTQVLTDLSINASTNVKLALAALKIGLRAVAALIDTQGQQTPGAMTTAQSAAPQTVNRIKQLSNAADADWILKAAQK